MDDAQYLAALQIYWKRHSVFPSMAKLAEVVGLANASSVFSLVGRLVESGYLERVEGRIAPTRKFFGRPVFGAVRAGLPQAEGQDEPELLTIDDYLISNPDRTIICRVRGDSMTGAGLLDGDLVIVEKNSATKKGDIVVALVDGDLTVKYLRMARGGSYFLEAANPAYAPIHPAASLEILGVVIGSFRKIRN